MKSILRCIYRALPFKRFAIHKMRNFGFGNFLSVKMKSYLVFEGVFKVSVGNKYFLMESGYGRDIESTLFWDGLDAFEGSTMHYWKILTRMSKVIIDVGANTGVYSLVAKTLNPDAQIYSFEPLDRIYDILVKNISINTDIFRESQTRIIASKMAVSDYNGIGKMFDLPVLHMYTASLNKDIHLERGNKLPACERETEVTRLDEYLEQNNCLRVDLIKIDVESHEPYVLRGFGELLQRHKPSIIVEIWDDIVGEGVEKVLKDCDYLYFAILDSGAELREHIRNEFPAKGYINYLVVTKKMAVDLGLKI